jgi:hypothetical protein
MSLIPRLRASLSSVWPFMVVQMEEYDVWLVHNSNMHPTMIHLGRANDTRSLAQLENPDMLLLAGRLQSYNAKSIYR